MKNKEMDFSIQKIFEIVYNFVNMGPSIELF